jgi:multidrug efflux pump subunit AcrB
MVNNFIAAISHFFAGNKSLSYLILATIVVFGLVSFWVMPKQYNPEIIRPAFVVSFDYAGANPEEALNRVGYELVEKIQVVKGVEDIYTKISDGANVTATVMFEVGYDKAKAKVDLLTQLESHSYLAKGAVSNLLVQEINPETIPVMQIVFSSDLLTQTEIRELVQKLRQNILAVNNVSEVSVVGAEDSGLLVEINPVALAAHDLDLVTLSQSLSGVSVKKAGGVLESESSITKVVLDSSIHTPAAMSDLLIAPNTKLGEVAVVYEGVRPNRSYVWYADKNHEPTDVVMMSVSKREGSSAPTVTSLVKQRLETEVGFGEFKNLSYKIVSDDGVVAREEIGGLTSNLLSSILIVGLVLFLFLSSRAALVVLITVPLTFLSVLAIGFLSGESINRITLFALILSLGLLVDAAIVVVDNIYDHLKLAYQNHESVNLPKVAAGAIGEVGVGLVLSALTSVVVFLPMNYITGMMGPYMGPISFFVPMALIASLVIAIVLTPFIAIRLLRHDEKENWLSGFFRRLLDKVTKGYVAFLRRIAYENKFRTKVLRTTVIIFLLTLVLPLLGFVHFQMLPKADRDQLYLYIDAPEGSSREYTNDLTKRVTASVLGSAEVLSVESFVAGRPIVDFNGLFKGASSRVSGDQATVRVDLTKNENRRLSSTEIASDLRTILKQDLGSEAGFVRLMEEPPGPPVAATFEAKISADKKETSDLLLNELKSLIFGVSGIVDVYDSKEAPVGQLVYSLNHEQLVSSGVALGEITTWYQVVSAPLFLTEYIDPKSSERKGVYLTVPYAYRQSAAGFSTVPVLTDSGEVTSLAGFFDSEYLPLDSDIYLEQVVPVQYLTAEVEQRSIVYVMIELIKKITSGELGSFSVDEWSLFDISLSNGTDKAKISWGGEWEMTLENFRDLGVAMVVALFLVYAVLVAQYSSFSIPGFILVTVPLGLIGIFSGFLFLDQFFGIYLTATALIGFIALIGIVVNNAIIYLEYVEQAIASGLDFKESLIAAGSARLRPILLTSMTTVLGSLTIASDPVWSGLAWSFVFGLSLSTLLTLVVLPSVLIHFRDGGSIATN